MHGRLAALAVVVALAVIAAAPARAQCDTWNLGASGNWFGSSGWNLGDPNSSSTDACITDMSSTVTLNSSAAVHNLTLANGNMLSLNPNTSLTVYGPQIANAGGILVNGGGNTNAYLYAPSSLTLSGMGGTLTLSTTTSGGGGNAYFWLYNGATVENVNNTIQGEGIIYNNGTTLLNDSGGVINANSTGSPLANYLAVEYGTVNNKGLMEATNSGVLQLYSATVNNAGGGSIVANGPGASVQLQGADIQGGTLTNNGGAFFGTPTGYNAFLDGSTTAGAITLNGTYTSDLNSSTYLYGTINNTGNLLANGGGNTNAYLYVPSGLTLQGGGTVSLNTTTSGGGGNAYLYQYGGGTLENVNNTIQGGGIIYNDGTTLLNDSGGVINANSTGSPLANYLAVEYGTVNNKGLMEATNSGVLQLYDTTVNNTGGGSIVANGPGASVQFAKHYHPGRDADQQWRCVLRNAYRLHCLLGWQHDCGRDHS